MSSYTSDIAESVKMQVLLGYDLKHFISGKCSFDIKFEMTLSVSVNFYITNYLLFWDSGGATNSLPYALYVSVYSPISQSLDIIWMCLIMIMKIMTIKMMMTE